MRFVAVVLPAVLAATAAPALAQTSYYERATSELPAQIDPSVPLVVISPQAGSVHWGVDGWKSVTDTALEGPCVDGRYRAIVGPLVGHTEVDLDVHYANNTWDSNGGKDYRVPIVSGAPIRRRPITIGPGPYIGTVGNVAYNEDLLDWELADCRGVSANDDEVPIGDGDDDSRNIVAFYSRRENGNLYLRVDLLDLGLGAETRGNLVLGFLISWGGAGGQTYLPEFAEMTTSHPWNAAFVVHDESTCSLYNASWDVVADASSPSFRGASYRSDLDGVEIGLALSALQQAGWNGTAPLSFQVYSMKDGGSQVLNVFQQASLSGGVITAQVSETATSGTAKLATIVHGNQEVTQPSAVRELIESQTMLTPNGNPTGYFRALDAHETFRAPLNFHVSATLATTIQWAQPDFNARIKGFLSGTPWLGRGAFLGGVLSEHIIPYFEGAGGPNTEGARLNERVLSSIYGASKPTVFWTPERVIAGATFADIASAGYGYTVIDQVTTLQNWFGDAATTGNKINQINGVNCFMINDDVDAWKFANTDGGLWLDSRRLLLGQALDSDQQKLTVIMDDWEAASGRSFTSFTVGNDNPDNYDVNVRWLAEHPWVQVVTLDEVASWGWTPIQRGTNTNLPLETYDFLIHASCGSYDNWVHGSSLNQDFATWQPQILGNLTTAKPMGVFGQSGTILHDAWQDVVGLPSSELRNLGEAVYGAAAYETAWHDNNQTDYEDKTSTGAYQYPVTQYQNVSAWALAVNGHAGDASLVAAAAQWAQSPPAAGTTKVWSQDVDQDGQPELLIATNQALCIFKTTGGRMVLAAVRDPVSGDADLLVGSLLQGPSTVAKDEEETTTSAVCRPPALVDWWATNGGSSYVNATYSSTLNASSIVLTSSDGNIAKTISLAGNTLSVQYATKNVGPIYVRSAFSPAPMALFAAEGTIAEQTPRPSTLVLTEQSSGRTVSATITAGANASINAAADFGTDGPRSVVLTRQVEIQGAQGSFGLSMSFSLTH
jgi:hypothetical protein